MNWEEITFGAIVSVGLIEWLKAFDKEKKWKKYYKLLPLLVSFVPAYFISTIDGAFSIPEVMLNQLGIFSFSILQYTTIIEVIEKKLKTP